jgi:hypothetical protein
MRRGAVAGENKMVLMAAGRTPMDGIHRAVCARLRDTYVLSIADDQDETRENVRFALESEAMRVRIAVSEYVSEVLVAHLNSLRQQEDGVVQCVAHARFEHPRYWWQSR